MKTLLRLFLGIGVFLLAATSVLAKGFDDTGYNYTARIFNGTGMQWCMAKVGDVAWCNSYLGAYANDKIVMKWNAEWDRGNAENWSNPPYAAWENNEWNGNVAGGSGAVWHYKIKWVGDCDSDPSLLPAGAYCIWGEFATVMDQGTDPSYGPGHFWFAHGIPSGYGN